MVVGRYINSAFFVCLLLFELPMLSMSPAFASGEICRPELKFQLRALTECSNIAALTPGNDTRVNLLLLLLDRHGPSVKPSDPITKPVFDWRELRESFSTNAQTDVPGFVLGEGSRCRSGGGGRAAFEKAVMAANGLSSEEQAALLAARSGFKLNCAAEGVVSTDVEDLVGKAKSAISKSFAIYLRGAASFYGGQFDEAEKDFESLRNNPDQWLADTGAYMAARSLVNLMQVDVFDEYGSFIGSEKVDQAAAMRAEASLDRYLVDHPNGQYAASARGLQRRVDWLAGWNDKLAARYAALLAMPASTRGIDDVSLVEEIDSKLLPNLTPTMTRDPLLLAILDLKSMRREPADKNTALDLDAQRDAFAGELSFFDFLKASQTLHIDGASSQILKAIPDDTRRRDGGFLWFSRQFLRGEALEAIGDRNARGFWKELYPGAKDPLEQSVIQLALALHQERHGELREVFEASSLVSDPMMRDVLLENDADPALLRAQAHNPAINPREHKVALFTLLYKELTRGFYADFLTDSREVSADAAVEGEVFPEPGGDNEVPLGLFVRGKTAGDIGCPPLSTTVSNLSRDPVSPRNRLCLAEFVRLNQMDQEQLDAPPPKDELGSMPTMFPGTPYARATTYHAIIDDKNAPAAARAYSLYRAVKCYEPSGNNRCGGSDDPKAKRKAWFTELKREFPTSRWADGLQYWW